MKKLLLLLALVLSFGQMLAQKGSIWNKVSASHTATLNKIRPNVQEEGELYFSLNAAAFKQNLVNTRDKFSKQAGVVVEFPNMNGELERFNVWENSNMTPDFQAQFPEIRAYVGKGITDAGATIHFSVSPQGIQTMVFRANTASEFIEALDKEATTYVLFNSRNRNQPRGAFNCSTIDSPIDLTALESQNLYGKSSNKKYKTMRLALSCTAEYANHFQTVTGGTDPTPVIAAMNATMTRVNGVMEKDLAVHLNMINNTSIIFYNTTTDPYADAGTAGSGDGLGADGAWNAQLQSTLTSIITEANYDIGHLFGFSGGGGNAGCIGCVCLNGQKGSGFTSPGSGLPVGDSFDIDYVAHEMGHQLGGNHTFTFGYEGTTAQTEPGSGSTIMGYAGVTNYNVQTHSDPVYSYKSITQIQTNLNSKTCPVSTTMANNTPVVNAGADYTIPVGTAFMLTGTATDADAGDVLTYLWEQNDVGNSTTVNASSEVLQTKTVGPNFRTFKPSTNIFRYCPQMGKILNGALAVTAASTSNWESVSSVTRNLNFTFTARDNQAGGGQTASDAMVVAVNTAGGAFSVSSQSTTGISYAQGSTQTVTWVPGSTASTPYNSPTVDILMTTNASTALESFNATTPTSPNPTTWTTIASGVPNNGSYDVTIPATAPISTTCRFMVKAVGNIFLAVNAKNFAITALGTEEFGGGLANFSLYPNPNTGNFTVKFDSSSTNDIAITVHDIRGRKVFENIYSNTGVFTQNLQLDSVQAGIYLVTVKDGDRKVVKKIVVE